MQERAVEITVDQTFGTGGTLEGTTILDVWTGAVHPPMGAQGFNIFNEGYVCNPAKRSYRWRAPC